MTKEQALEYLRRNKELLKLNNVGKVIGVSATVITKAVNGTPDSQGYPVSLPDRCLPKLAKLIKERLNPHEGF